MNPTSANPYESSQESDPDPGSRSSVLIAFALLNFAVATLLAISSVVSVVGPESPFQFLGGIILFIPVSIYAFCEWLVLSGRKPSLERRLGYLNLACAAFTLFGVVTSVGEAIVHQPTDNQLVLWIALIGIAITAYLIGSGWYRVRMKHPSS